jgi:hypothetical protein
MALREGGAYDDDRTKRTRKETLMDTNGIQRRRRTVPLGGVVGLPLILITAGCAGDPPKPAPTVTPEQVRSHADKAFEKLKQEEQNRSGDQTAPRD